MHDGQKARAEFDSLLKGTSRPAELSARAEFQPAKLHGRVRWDEFNPQSYTGRVRWDEFNPQSYALTPAPALS